MSVLRWLWDFWYIPLLFILAVVGLFLWTKTSDPGPVQKITDELRIIESMREARAVQLQLGAEEAKKHVQEKYAVKRKRLKEADEARAKELEDDPVALARLLERLSRSSS